MSIQKPREIAFRILTERLHQREFSEVLLDRALQRNPLPPNDRRLCQELVFGVVRWSATLDWLIRQKTGGRTQKAALQTLLELGLYQMFWLDRIPPHAAVHESVQLAKTAGYGAQSGFINAVLRAYSRELDTTRTALHDLKRNTPHLGFSHPEWLC
ncbi:MAG TPA: transcription antitermination factor NusB, partial [Methylomirabilota bacterium]|nr:transcription antitermination factor NusB [Methylomirabilota bacterium]